MLGPTMLEVRGLHSYYGLSHVLLGISFTVPEGSVAALLGRNGAGKTTALRSIMGLVARRTGQIELAGQDISARRPHQIARAGVSYDVATHILDAESAEALERV